MALLSQSYFSYLFKIQTGMTFVEYINRQRVKKALELLQATDSSILEICFACGFNSINHFNRIFKRFVNMPPRKYRQAADLAATDEKDEE